MTTATALRPGQIISVRAFYREPDGHGGLTVRKTGWRDAIVMGEFMDRPMIWVPSLGAPTAQPAVQPLFADMRYRDHGKDVLSLSPNRLAELKRQLNRDDIHLAVGLFRDLLHQVTQALNLHRETV